jgi:hypothetical protein
VHLGGKRDMQRRTNMSGVQSDVHVEGSRRHTVVRLSGRVARLNGKREERSEDGVAVGLAGFRAADAPRTSSCVTASTERAWS